MTRFAVLLRPAGRLRQRKSEPMELCHGVHILGRSPQTKVKQQLCSRRQLELNVDTSTGSVTLKQLGPNASAVDGKPVAKGEVVTVPRGSRIAFVADNPDDTSFMLDIEEFLPDSTPVTQLATEDTSVPSSAGSAPLKRHPTTSTATTTAKTEQLARPAIVIDTGDESSDGDGKKRSPPSERDQRTRTPSPGKRQASSSTASPAAYKAVTPLLRKALDISPQTHDQSTSPAPARKKPRMLQLDLGSQPAHDEDSGGEGGGRSPRHRGMHGGRHTVTGAAADEGTESTRSAGRTEQPDVLRGAAGRGDRGRREGGEEQDAFAVLMGSRQKRGHSKEAEKTKSNHREPRLDPGLHAPAKAADTSKASKWAKAGADHWANALTAIVRHPERHTSEIVFETDDTIVISDKYPKARYHFLVMPREVIPDLTCLTRKDRRMIQRLQETAMAFGQKLQRGRPEIKFLTGFHAVPSMNQVHLHLISQDFDSVSLKNKKHWNSFHTPYFVPARKVYEMLKEQGHVHFDEAKYKEYLKRSLVCHKCHQPMRNMPILKQHLKEHMKSKT